MKVYKTSLVIIILLMVLQPSLFAQEESPDSTNITSDLPWDKFSFSFGGFLADLSSSAIIGSNRIGLGISINLEDALGLDVSGFVIRSNAMYRFGTNNKHSARADFFSFKRRATKTLESDLEIGDTIFPIGSKTTSIYNLQIIKASYDFAFLQDNRVNFGASVGLYIMPITLKIESTSALSENTHFVAPLPVLGIRSDLLLAPKLFMKQSAEFLYLKIDNFKGSIMDLNINIEYNIWDHIGLGAGFNYYRLTLEADGGDDYPLFELEGYMEISYTGFQFYGKYYF